MPSACMVHIPTIVHAGMRAPGLGTQQCTCRPRPPQPGRLPRYLRRAESPRSCPYKQHVQTCSRTPACKLLPGPGDRPQVELTAIRLSPTCLMSRILGKHCCLWKQLRHRQPMHHLIATSGQALEMAGAIDAPRAGLLGPPQPTTRTRAHAHTHARTHTATATHSASLAVAPHTRRPSGPAAAPPRRHHLTGVGINAGERAAAPPCLAMQPTITVAAPTRAFTHTHTRTHTYIHTCASARAPPPPAQCRQPSLGRYEGKTPF